MPRPLFSFTLLTCASLGLVGCMPKMDAESMKEMRPKRPVELDRLNMLLGTWESTAEVKIAGMDEPMKGSGKTTAAWDCNGWCLIEHGQYDMGGMGKMNEIAIWTYDCNAKRYRVFWTGDYGDTSYGTARYDETNKTWHMSAEGHGAEGSSRSSGTIKAVDDRTMEWTFTERMGPFGMFKVMDMKGTSKKK